MRTFKAVHFEAEGEHAVPHAYDEETCDRLGCQIREVFEFPVIIKHMCPMCCEDRMARGYAGDDLLYCVDCGSELIR